MKKIIVISATALTFALAPGCAGNSQENQEGSAATDTASAPHNDSIPEQGISGTDPSAGRQDSSKNKAGVGPGDGKKTGTDSDNQKYN